MSLEAKKLFTIGEFVSSECNFLENLQQTICDNWVRDALDSYQVSRDLTKLVSKYSIETINFNTAWSPVSYHRYYSKIQT